MRHIKRCAAILLTVSMLLGALPTAAGAEPTFTDVPTTHWAFASIEQAAADGIVEGVGNNKFSPSGTITVPEFTTMLVRGLYDKFNEEAEAKNVKAFGGSDTWYAPYTLFAAMDGMYTNTEVENKHTAGDTNLTYFQFVTGSIEWNINRYDMAAMMQNATVGSGISSIDNIEKVNTWKGKNASSKISDWSSIPEQYQYSVAFCYYFGLLAGTDSKGTFSGTATMTRAEAATVMCRLMDAKKNGLKAIDDSTTTEPTPTPGTSETQKPDGYTPASSVNSIQNRNKSDKYPTTGNSESVSVNGYFTGSTVDAGKAVLVYDFLEWVNEARHAEGLNELEWVSSDAAEEYTLIRANDLTTNFSHFGGHAGFSQEVIAGGGGAGTDKLAFNLWMESEGHRRTLMMDSGKYMCAARCGHNWIITIWREPYEIPNVENASTDYLTWSAKTSEKDIICAHCGFIMLKKGALNSTFDCGGPSYFVCDICKDYYLCYNCSEKYYSERIEHQRICKGY